MIRSYPFDDRNKYVDFKEGPLEYITFSVDLRCNGIVGHMCIDPIHIIPAIEDNVNDRLPSNFSYYCDFKIEDRECSFTFRRRPTEACCISFMNFIHSLLLLCEQLQMTESGFNIFFEHKFKDKDRVIVHHIRQYNDEYENAKNIMEILLKHFRFLTYQKYEGDFDDYFFDDRYAELVLLERYYEDLYKEENDEEECEAESNDFKIEFK